jgi:hypothetical protein
MDAVSERRNNEVRFPNRSDCAERQALILTRVIHANRDQAVLSMSDATETRDRLQLDDWVENYGRAWETGDAELVLTLH